VNLIALPDNLGAAARNVGVAAAATPLVAFSDDDSWWAPDALDLAADVFEDHPRLGLLAASVLVGAEDRLDPTCAAMADSPLPRRRDLPGPAILGFLACGAVVRRFAFLDAGGFPEGFGVGGEEAPLALALAGLGWDLAYVERVLAHHHPSSRRTPYRRQVTERRNELWTAWTRLPTGAALVESWRLLQRGRHDPAARAGAVEALRGLPLVLGDRRPVPRRVVRAWCALDERPPHH
jgi:GT2 family glycosyltransferase